MRLLPVLAMMVLAGCAGPADDLPPSGIGERDAEGPRGNGPQLLLDIDERQVTTKASTVTIRGAIEPKAVLSFKADDENVTLPSPQETEGNWSVQIQVPFGKTNVTVAADDGQQRSTILVEVTRLAKVTMQVTYRGGLGLIDRDDDYWIDVDDHVSARSGQYDGCSQKHPGYANVHDAMMVWTARLNRSVTYGACGDFGVSVEAIEGHESPGFWCYEVNGEAADFGITLQRIRPGDIVGWDDCAWVLD